MRTESVNVFTFEELSDRAKESARDWWRELATEPAWADEWRTSLTAFCNATGIEARDWDIGYPGTYIRYEFPYHITEDVMNLTGIRLRTWLINNWLPHFRKGKYLGWVNGRAVHSKCQLTYDDCPLTGYCGDMALIQPLLDFVAKPDDRDLDSLITCCLYGWAHEYEADIEAQQADEYIDDCLIANEYEFTENGQRWI